MECPCSSYRVSSRCTIGFGCSIGYHGLVVTTNESSFAAPATAKRISVAGSRGSKDAFAGRKSSRTEWSLPKQRKHRIACPLAEPVRTESLTLGGTSLVCTKCAVFWDPRRVGCATNTGPRVRRLSHKIWCGFCAKTHTLSQYLYLASYSRFGSTVVTDTKEIL